MKVIKKIYAVILLVVIFASLFTGCDRNKENGNENDSSAVVHTTKVITLNMLVNEPAVSGTKYNYYGTDMQAAVDYNFERRLEYIKAMFDYANPDVLLLQEFSGPNFWGKTLKVKTTDTTGVYIAEEFPDYLLVNHGNRRGVLYENNLTKTDAFASHNFVMFDSTKFEYISSGTRFVTADGTRENSWTDNSTSGLFNDLGDYTWVVLKDKETGFVSIYTTIHTYTNNIQRKAYVLQNLQYVTEYLETVSAEYDNAPVIIGGDFNLDPDNVNCDYPYQHMTEVAHYIDSNTEGDDTGTTRELGNRKSDDCDRIDFIFANGGKAKNYEVLSGQVQLTADGGFEYVPESPLDGTMYDISDHQPVYAEIVFKKDSKLKPADISGMYNNPSTADDKIITDDADVSFDNNILKFDTTKALSAVKTGDGLWANIVEDETEGKVLRIVAADELNKVGATIDFQALAGDVNIADYKKITITYRTEFSLGGCEVDCDVTAGSNSFPTMTVTNTWGKWKKITLRKGSLEGAIGKIKFEGERAETGLLKGDAIYISSIQVQ